MTQGGKSPVSNPSFWIMPLSHGVGVDVGVGVAVPAPHATGVPVAVAVGLGVAVGDGIPTAAAMSTRPQPYTLFGGPAVPHRVEAMWTAALFKVSRLAVIWCRRLGNAHQSK